MFRVFVVFISLSLCFTSNARVLIITHNFNGAKFIKYQKELFDRFLLNEYEFVVFNDANQEGHAQSIERECAINNIRCIRVPQEIHTRPYLPRLPKDPLHRPNIRHANCVQYSMDILGFHHDGIVLILDSDNFLIRPLDLEKYMKDFDIAAYLKGADNGVYYICPALAIFNIPLLPDVEKLNFNCGVANGASVDSGGWTYYYLKLHPGLRLNSLSYLPCHTLFLANYDIHRPHANVPDNQKIIAYEKFGLTSLEIEFLLKKPDTFEFFFDQNFIHYHEGTNHGNQPAHYHQRKWQIFTDFFNKLLEK